MREIKFRAWNNEQKHFVLLHSLLLDHQGIAAIDHDVLGKAVNPNSKDYTVTQFTGLLDKNGKEIYEGDIVRSDNNPRLLVTVYDEHYGSFLFEDPNNHTDCEIVGLHNKHGEKLGELTEREVIGNIHQNPELLPLTYLVDVMRRYEEKERPRLL